MGDSVYEKVFDLAKRRGFLYPAFEIYGGAAGFYDYGPLGAQLKALLEAKFRQIDVVEEGAAEINTPAITIEPVLKASGHVDHFSDVVVTCKTCGSGFRGDHLVPEESERIGAAAGKLGLLDLQREIESLAKDVREHPNPDAVQRALQGLQRASDEMNQRAKQKVKAVTCPNCHEAGIENPQAFNLMFKTQVGPGTAKIAYLRPETAQAMFIDFPSLYRYFREQLPFAACQIGRAYRNEISPRQGLIRLREFNQMEVEAFYDPGPDPRKMTHPRWGKVEKTLVNLVPNTTQQSVSMTIGEAVKQRVVHNAALGYHLALVQRLLTEIGLKPDRLRFRQHLKDEMAHYAADCWDAEFHSGRFDWVECVGIAYRTDFDLSQHEKHSGKPLKAMRRFDAPITRERTHVVPVSAKLGPLFKRDAPRIAAALEALGEAEAESARDAPHLEIRLDATTHRVPRDAYDVQRTTETVHGEPFVPHVIEPSYGQDRILYGVLEHSLHETTKEGEAYSVLQLPPATAPITVSVFPLMAKDGLDERANQIAEALRQEGLRVAYDDAGAIGRRYARADEIGTPWCVTVDYDTVKDDTVTLRDRDTTTQVRIGIAKLAGELHARIRATPAAPPKAPSAVSPEAA